MPQAIVSKFGSVINFSMAKLLQHNIEAIHRLKVIQKIPVVVFSRDELSEETLLPSGNFELFWYANIDNTYHGAMEVLNDLNDIERDVEIMLKSAEDFIITKI